MITTRNGHAALEGTRLYVTQVWETWCASGQSIPLTAEYFGITEEQVIACVAHAYTAPQKVIRP